MRGRLARAGRYARSGDAALSAAPSELARRRRGLAIGSSWGSSRARASSRGAGSSVGLAAQHAAHALPLLSRARDCARGPKGSGRAPVRGGVLARGGGVLSRSGLVSSWRTFATSSVDSRVNVSTAPGSFAGVAGGEMLWAWSHVLGPAAAAKSPRSDSPPCNSQSTLEKTVLWCRRGDRSLLDGATWPEVASKLDWPGNAARRIPRLAELPGTCPLRRCETVRTTRQGHALTRNSVRQLQSVSPPHHHYHPHHPLTLSLLERPWCSHLPTHSS